MTGPFPHSEIAVAAKAAPLIDPFQRAITYLRVSVTDRCDFRCVYCMSEHMAFLPKAEVLSLEELDRLCSAFVARGVRKLRLTGGEPLVRRGIMTLVQSLSRHLKSGALDELTLTTNGSQLTKYAGELKACGVERINVSLDTLDPDKFRAITRWGELGKVMAGVDAARQIRRRTRRLRHPPHQRLARHARSAKIPRHHPLGRSRQGAGGYRSSARRGARGEDQRGRAEESE